MKYRFVYTAFFVCAIFSQKVDANHPVFDDLFYQQAAGLFCWGEENKATIQANKPFFIILFDLVEKCFKDWKESAMQEESNEIVLVLPVGTIGNLFDTLEIIVRNSLMNYDKNKLKIIYYDFWYFLFSIFRLAIQSELGYKIENSFMREGVTRWTNKLMGLNWMTLKFMGYGSCTLESYLQKLIERYENNTKYRKALHLEAAQIIKECRANIA